MSLVFLLLSFANTCFFFVSAGEKKNGKTRRKKKKGEFGGDAVYGTKTGTFVLILLW